MRFQIVSVGYLRIAGLLPHNQCTRFGHSMSFPVTTPISPPERHPRYQDRPPARRGRRHQSRHTPRALRAGPRQLREPRRCPTNPLQGQPPDRKSAEPLKMAIVGGAEQLWRAVAALDCEPSPAGRFYALFGLLTTAEGQLFTSQACMQARLIVPRRESRAAANDCDAARLAELGLASNLPLPRPVTGGAVLAAAAMAAAALTAAGTAPAAAAAAAATALPHPRAVLAAAATSSEAGSDSDDSDPSNVPAATAAPASPVASPRHRPPPVYCYTGNRAQDEAEAARRVRHRLCLQCLRPATPTRLARARCTTRPTGVSVRQPLPRLTPWAGPVSSGLQLAPQQGTVPGAARQGRPHGLMIPW